MAVLLQAALELVLLAVLAVAGVMIVQAQALEGLEQPIKDTQEEHPSKHRAKRLVVVVVVQQLLEQTQLLVQAVMAVMAAMVFLLT